MKHSKIKLTESQIDELKLLISWKTKLFRLFLYILLIAIIAYPVYMIQLAFLRIDFPLWLVAALFLFIFFLKSSKKLTGGKELEMLIKQEIKEGFADRMQIEVEEVIEVQEEEDLGLLFFIKTTEGEILYFFGQYLYGYKNQGFPWKAFSIIKVASGQFFQIQKDGDAFTPIFIRESLSSKEMKKYKIKNFYGVIHEDFESLKTKQIKR